MIQDVIYRYNMLFDFFHLLIFLPKIFLNIIPLKRVTNAESQLVRKLC